MKTQSKQNKGSGQKPVQGEQGPAKKKRRATRKGRPKTDPRAISTKVRIAEWLRLRTMGLTYAEIGKQTGVTPQRCCTAVNKALRDMVSEPAAELITLELTRLDDMYSALYPKILSGSVGAVGAALRILERRAKLMGLDAPQRVEHSGGIETSDWRADTEAMLKDPDARKDVLAVTMELAKYKNMERQANEGKTDPE